MHFVAATQPALLPLFSMPTFPMPVTKMTHEGLRDRKPSREKPNAVVAFRHHDVLGHLSAMDQETVVCRTMAKAIVKEDWESVHREAWNLPEMVALLERCDPVLDSSLDLSLAVYVYRALAAAGQERYANPVMEYIARSPYLDRLISRVLHLEKLPSNELLEDEIRDRLVLLLCHENFARRWWRGKAIYYDPAKNTLQGWVGHPQVRRGLINLRECMDRFYGTIRNPDVLSYLPDEGEDPVLDALAEDPERNSIFDTASLFPVGLFLQGVILRYGVEDTRRAIRSVLRYQARTAPKLFERKSLMIETLAVIQAIHPALSLHIVGIEFDPQSVANAASMAKEILNDRLEADVTADASAVYAWMGYVRTTYEGFLDAVLSFDQASVVNGRRMVSRVQKDDLRKRVGMLLADHLEMLGSKDR